MMGVSSTDPIEARVLAAIRKPRNWDAWSADGQGRIDVVMLLADRRELLALKAERRRGAVAEDSVMESDSVERATGGARPPLSGPFPRESRLESAPEWHVSGPEETESLRVDLWVRLVCQTCGGMVTLEENLGGPTTCQCREWRFLGRLESRLLG